jgi:hypothetical protein
MEVVVPEASPEDITAIYQPPSDEGPATYNEEDVEDIAADAELESTKVDRTSEPAAVPEPAAEAAAPEEAVHEPQ